MSLVTLVSGGLDSTMVGVLAREQGVSQFPLFIDYGQRARNKEWETCQRVHEEYHLPEPVRMDLSGYGAVIASGLTREDLDIKDQAFTPGRNLLFALMGAAYAYQQGASSVALGLLSEDFSIFPDQTNAFLRSAEATIKLTLGREIDLVAPLGQFSKTDVVNLAKQMGILGTYSCHTGADVPCGKCISCLEYER